MSHTSTGQSKWMSRERGRAQGGAMTASMRAVSSPSTKVLRVALARGGRIVEERVLRERTTITCGTSERCVFVVGGAAPEVHALFEIVAGRYVLNVTREMRGTIATSSGTHDLAALAAVGSSLSLDDDARGKVVLGDTAVLFQHVDAPVEARAKLPLSVRRGLGVDWNLTVIAAFSFLFHFGLVGASYSDFADPVHDEGSIVSVVDQIRNLPSPIDVESTPADPLPQPSPDKPPSTDSQPSKTPSTVATTTHAPPASPGVSVNEAEQARVAILLAYGSGQRVAVLDPNAPMLPAGVWVGRPGDPRDPNAIPTKPDAPLFVPGTPGPIPTTNVHVDPGPIAIKPPALPPVVVSPGPPVGPVDPTPLASLSPRARYCYQQALLRNPDQQGRVVIAIKVGPGGDVVGSNVVSSSGLDASVGQCILGATTALRFKSPGPSGGQINVPFTFVKQ